MNMYRQVRSEGECRFAPIACGGVCAIVMVLVVLLMGLFPSIPDLARFTVMIAFAAVGGHLGGVLAMTLNYQAGKKHLGSNSPITTEANKSQQSNR